MNNRGLILVLTLTILLPYPLKAEEARVNTMRSMMGLPQPSVAEVKRGAAAIKLPKDLKVPDEWIPLLNRAFEDYWMEGNHRPDAGFVLFARNPSKETAKLWLLRMESKAQNLEELFSYVKEAQKELVGRGLMVDRFGMVGQASATPAGLVSKNKPDVSRANISRAGLDDLEFYFLFSPACHHCARLAQSLVGFPNVHPLQVIDGELVNWPGLPESDRATPETIAAYVKDGDQPGGVPVLAIHHPKSNRILKLRGARSSQEILAAAAAVQSQAKTKIPFLGPVNSSLIGSNQPKEK
jgi:hypothetical protein